MQEENHKHKWQVLRAPNMLECVVKGCHTVTTLDTLLANLQFATALETKIKVYSEQLFGKHLRKQQHEAVYRWVIANDPDAIPQPSSEQTVLL